MAIKLNLNFDISTLADEQLTERNVSINILRLDQIHPTVSGNKWFKLKEYIKAYQNGNYKGIISFGGAYSNHLVATAAACNYYQIPCLGIVRGLEAQNNPSKTLMECANLGMHLKYLSRAAYKEKENPTFLEKIAVEYPQYLIIPEGGYGALGIAGAQQICDHIPDFYDTICLAVGSATTFCGIVSGSKKHQQIIGFPALKGGAYLMETIAQNTSRLNWELKTDYHFGGFGKHKPELIHFMNHFKKRHQIELDFVYTAKMMFGVFESIQKEDWHNRNILCIHTGGLQGNSSIQNLLR